MFDFDSLKRSKALALLLDPDKTVIDDAWLAIIKEANPDLILIGGSQPFSAERLDDMVKKLKANLSIPLIGFPGDITQIHKDLDGLLALSVVQSVDAQFVLFPLFQVASLVRKLSLPTFYTPYLILGTDGQTAVELALKNKLKRIHEPDIFENFIDGLNILNPPCVYLEAGSGSTQVLNSEFVRIARRGLKRPYLLAGGGIRFIEQAEGLWQAGADCIVVGNWIEQSPKSLLELSAARNKMRHC